MMRINHKLEKRRWFFQDIKIFMKIQVSGAGFCFQNKRRKDSKKVFYKEISGASLNPDAPVCMFSKALNKNYLISFLTSKF